ncbi:MAG: beta-glucosidase [Oscillospiraceae bacterium]|nr:beta-glucosidase [Oscillospiraceae bacterium]
MSKFPKGFLWGAASSAYQIEGFSTADGGGASIWDTFSHTPGKIAYDDHGDVACDAYHRYEEDIALMKELGIKAYRFSTSWARIDPNADGNWNAAGLAYYERIVDGCLAAGIEPYMTLYHWELPQAAEDRGGWRVEETAHAFARFAGMMAKHFKGRVKNYFTLNEPQCTTSLGYAQGLHAPGLKLSLKGQFHVHVNQMIAHGLAQRAIKETNPAAMVGIASTGNLCYPETEADIAAARAATFATAEAFWVFTHHWLLDPICLGRFPDCAGTALEPLVQAVTPQQLELIHTVPDMLGFNVYNGHEVRTADAGFEYVPKYAGFPRTALKWPVTPEVLGWGMKFLHERYSLPMYITENGLSCNDRIYLDGKVHDPDRIDFLTRYLNCLHHAIELGADIQGYFHWSLTDNFEWHSGYGDRFGLVYMDYPNLRRIPKDSFRWYKEVIRTGEVAFPQE